MMNEEYLNIEDTQTQCNDILRYCKEHGCITTWDAMTKLRIARLASRIYDLKEDGWIIDGRMVSENGKRWKEYRIVGRKVA